MGTMKNLKVGYIELDIGIFFFLQKIFQISALKTLVNNYKEIQQIMNVELTKKTLVSGF